MKTFSKSFLLCLGGWVGWVVVAGLVPDYALAPEHTIKQFWRCCYQAVATWWFLVLMGSLLSALVFTVFWAEYQRWLSDPDQ